MAKKSISLANKFDQVFINGSNEIYGGYIFNVDVSLGFSEEKTMINVSVVSEDGNYQGLNKDQLDTSTPVEIQFGEGLHIPEAYLYEYEIQKSESSRILQLTYVDGSIVLDKIYVGLNYEAGIQFKDNVGAEKLLNFSLNCQPCPGFVGRRQVESEYLIFSKEFKNPQNTFSRDKGGYIIMGEEEFEADYCAIPPVSYTFTQLQNVLSREISFSSNFVDKNKDYRQKYTGTLREVLSSWCNDFGYSFYWNSIRKIGSTNQDDLIALDLSDPISIDGLKQQFELIDADKAKETVLLNLNEKFSLEGTKKTYRTSSFRKGAEPKETSYKLYKTQIASAITVDQLSASNFMKFGRTSQEFLISCVLSKFNKQLRDIYNYKLLVRDVRVKRYNETQQFTTVTSYNGVKPNVLGFESLSGAFVNINAEEQEEMFGVGQRPFGGFKDGANVSKFKPLNNLGKKNSDENVFYWVGGYNEEALNDLRSYEEQVADFIGKYYKAPELFYDYRFCDAEESYSQSVSNSVGAKKYNEFNDSLTNSPYNNIQRDISTSNIIGQNDLVFERTPAYGGNGGVDQGLSEILTFNHELLDFGETFEAIDTVDAYAPKVSKMDGDVVHIMRIRNPTFGSVVDSLGRSFSVLAAPTMDILNDAFRFSSLFGGAINNAESLSTSQSSQQTNPQECETRCERNFIEDICRCVTDAQGNPLNYDGTEALPPYDGLIDRQAFSFTVTTNLFDSTVSRYWNNGANFANGITAPVRSNTRTIILPVQRDYQFYYNLNINHTATMPSVASVHGTIGDADKYAQIDVSSEDITTKIETFYNNDSEQVINVFPPGTSDYVPFLPSDYHDARVRDLPIGVLEPKHELSVTMAGLHSSYYDQIDPSKGLQSFTLNYSSEGLNASFEFSNRPTELPIPDVMSKRIGPKIFNYNGNA